MPLSEYDYTKTPCAVDRLQQEIQTSSIATTLDHIDLLDSSLMIFFVSALSPTDQSTLNTLVTNHSGVGLATDFVKVTATATTSTNSASYIVLNSMASPLLVGGQYIVFFRGNFSTNVPLLTNPGVIISIFNNGSQVVDSELTEINNISGGFFDMVTIAQFAVTANTVVDVRWKTNGVGNTINCINRLLCLSRQK